MPRVPQRAPSLEGAYHASIFKPHATAEDVHAYLRKMQSPEVLAFVKKANNQYLHWDKLRRYPMPEGVTPLEMWGAIAKSRHEQFEDLPIDLNAGECLKYWSPPLHQQWLHQIDMDAGGSIGTRSKQFPRDDDDRFLINSLMEEAIASSQLEGAVTTRENAKAMLRTQRKPRNTSEQMVLNNYLAILEIREAKHDPLTPELLLHIQKTITSGTLENPAAAGRYRNESDGDICVVHSMTDEVIHRPPPLSQIEWRIKELCDFANTSHRSGRFIHPVIKAIALHFALGYIHPFADGNGRTARAIFYWYMLKSRYWVFEYLPISRIVLDSPAKYVRAYLYTETDSADLTYFIHYHLRLIVRAIEEMHAYFARQQHLMHEAGRALESYSELNHRQISLAYEAIRNPSATFTIKQHAGTFNITQATARADLFGLQAIDLLTKRKEGKRFVFSPALHLKKKMQSGAFRRVPRDSPSPKTPVKTQAAPPIVSAEQERDGHQMERSQPMDNQLDLFPRSD